MKRSYQVKSFAEEDTPGKSKFRIALATASADFDHINALTLCGGNRHFEKIVHKSNKNSYITSCETDRGVFENAASSINKNLRSWDMGNRVAKGRNEIHHIRVEDYLIQTQKRFNLIWLDYCGLVSKEIFDLKLMDRFEDGRAVFAITLLGNRYREDISRNMNGRSIQMFVRDEIYKLLPSQFEYDQELSGTYKDSSIMMNVVFRK